MHTCHVVHSSECVVGLASTTAHRWLLVSGRRWSTHRSAGSHRTTCRWSAHLRHHETLRRLVARLAHLRRHRHLGRWLLLWQLHLHDGRIIRNRVVNHAYILNVRPAEQNVIVTLILRRNRELRFAILRTIRFHCQSPGVEKGPSAIKPEGKSHGRKRVKETRISWSAILSSTRLVLSPLQHVVTTA